MKVPIILISLTLLCSASLYALDAPEEQVIKVYSKEQIAKQNILTLFRWIEAGSLDKKESRKAIFVIRKQLDVLKKEHALGKASWPQVYGYLDRSFFRAIVKGYEYEANNRPLLNRLFAEIPQETGLSDPRHPWLDVENNLIDYIENEAIISCAALKKADKIDLTKPEILVATDIVSIANLVEGSLNSILQTQLGNFNAYRLVHDGAASRGTSLDNKDFDFALSFDNQQGFNKFLKKIKPMMNLLSAKLSSGGYSIFSTDFEHRINSTRIVTFLIQDKDGIVLRVRITSGENLTIYADDINAQIEHIKLLGGNWEYLSGQIVLFKKLVRDVLHSYGKSYGGLDEMECEQFIMQAAGFSGYGAKFTSIGSFDKTMHWIYNIGLDRKSSAIVPFDGVINNNLKVEFSSSFWNKLVNAARKYMVLANIEMSEYEFSSLGYTLADAASYRKNANYAIEVLNFDSYPEFKKLLFSDVIPKVRKTLSAFFTENDIEVTDRCRYFIFFSTTYPILLTERLGKSGLAIKARYIVKTIEEQHL